MLSLLNTMMSPRRITSPSIFLCLGLPALKVVSSPFFSVPFATRVGDACREIAEIVRVPQNAAFHRPVVHVFLHVVRRGETRDLNLADFAGLLDRLGLAGECLRADREERP